MIAEGAGGFRRLTPLERLARQVARVPIAGRVRRSLKRAYLGLLNAQTSGKGLTATLPGGELVRVLPEHSYLGWNPEEYRAFREAVRPGGCALDIGANAGAYTVLLARWVGEHGRVFAFEPSAQAYAALLGHIALNGVGTTAVSHPVAIGERDGEVPLIESAIHGMSRMASAADRGAARSVPVTSIDTFCAREGIAPDFIKIDIEGWELAALRGARRTIRERGAKLALFVELHPAVWPLIGTSRAELENELASQGLDLVPLVSGVDPWSLEGMCVRLQTRDSRR